ncbi:MAG: tetratricopeptide repeat protein [Bacteroidota bacterium]
MKKVVLLAALAMPMLLLAQKEIKPSLPKAEKAFKEGKLDEAKTIIDITTASQEFMMDKKGQPTKKASEAWFYKGLIYMAIDTSKNQAFKGLEAEPYKVAIEAIGKSRSLSKDGNIDYYTDEMGLPKITETQIFPYFADAYSKKAITAYQEEKNYKQALEYFERTLYFMPEDTSVLMNAGVFFAPSAEEYDKAIVYIRKYQANGGKSPDAYIQLFSIYRDRKKDLETALAVAKEASAKFPNNSDFTKYELDIYIKMNKLPEALAIMEKQVKDNPNDKEARYFCGVITNELGNQAAAKNWFEEALKLDPKYFEAHLALAELVYLDAKKVKNDMNQLGNSKEDFKKKLDLDKQYQEKLRVSLPYWEACEKLSPDDPKVLDNLYLMYTDLEMTDKVARIEKKMKALGLLD